VSVSKAAVAALLLIVALAAAPSWAQDYPTKPIRMVVPFPAGGTVDILARLIGAKVQAQWGQPVVVEARTGAGGNVGADLVAKAEPDGYTLLLTASPPLTSNVGLYRDLPFNPLTDFAPVSLLCEVPNVLEVAPAVAARSAAELVALAKARPGTLNFGSQGNGTTSHLAGEMLKLKAGIDIVHVPYRGSAPALNDLVAGKIDLMFDNLVSSVPMIRAGNLRALAVGSAQRAPSLPDVPTLRESGLDFETTAWFAIVAPARTPPPIVARWSAAAADALRQPDVAARLADLGALTVASRPEVLGARMREEIVLWGDLIRTAKIKLD